MKLTKTVLCAALVCGMASAFAATNTYKGSDGGDWGTPENWSLERVPGSSDDVVISDHAVSVGTAVSVKSLTVSGASTVTFNAVALPDGQASTAANIYASPTVIAVSGAFSIEDTATVICANEPKTGAAVRFDVGSLTLAEGAKISSDGQSWGWYSGTSDPLATSVQGQFQTRALGPGGDSNNSLAYDRGAGHGAAGGNPSGIIGAEYGFKCAPFLPGSPNGLYGGVLGRGFRGGGTVWIRCAGLCEINGTVTANGLDAQFGAPSGGGIWICADSFAAGENASISAIGGNMTGNSTYKSVSAGGRISIGTGLSIAQQDALASGATPEAAGVVSVDRIDEIATSVKGGYKTGAPTQFGNSGTVTRVRGSMKVDFVLVGKGQVVANGVTHTEDFSLTVSCADGVSLKATASDDARFLSWSGAPVPEGFDEETETLLKPVDDGTVTVAFVEGAVRRVWTGRVSDDIATPANWTPASTMTAEDELYVTNGALVASAPFATGKLVLAGETTFTVNAVPLGDGIASTSANLYANPTVVTVAGELLVADTATVVCANDPKTGAAVRLDVGALTLAEGATISADAKGWNWYSSTGDSLATYTQGKYQSRALGAGGDDTSGNAYGQAAGHGAVGLRVLSGTRVRYGDAYGQELAPFEPGSPNGLQSHSVNNGTPGGGTVWIRCGGTCAVAGTITANGGQAQYSSGSGGSIWISAKAFESAETAVLSVRGGDMTGSTFYPAGAGGRIAVATGLTTAQLDALAAGETAEALELVVQNEIAGLTTDVRGGRKTSAATETYDAASGTVRRILGSVELEVAFAGKGQVTVGETTYTEGFTIDVSTKDGVTLLAGGLDGSAFVSWEGLPLTDGFSESAEISFVPQGDGKVIVNFAEGAVKRVWVGVDGGDLDAPLNWSPAGTHAATDELYFTNTVLAVDGALTAAKLVVAGESELTFNAVPLADGLASTTSNLYASPTVIAVAGEMAVEAGAKVVCANDPKTGAAVRFDVGSFRLAEGAVVSADGQGWFWYKSSGDPLATYTQGAYQCRAMGAGGDSNTGMSYNRGAGYGAAVGNASAPYGVEYGLKYAPFLPGSPNGLHSAGIGNGVRGGGTVWICCAGVCELGGTVSANGTANFYGAPSGGGIWLSAKGLKASASASLSANGGDMTGPTSYKSVAAGGRISLAIGVSDEQLDALARGEIPADVTCADEITLVQASVLGSRKTGASAPTYGNSGTVTTVTGPFAYVNVTVAGSPVAVRGCVPECGSPSFEGGSRQTFTAPAFGVDVADGRFGYTCAGYVVSNAQGEVTSGPGLSVEATIEQGLSVTWRWENPQKRVFVAKPAHGALTVDGVVQPGDVTLWTDGDFAPVGVVADDGYEFVCWSGKVPLRTLTANPLAVTVTEPLTLEAVMRPTAEPTSRTWNGDGVWTDAANWAPAGVPGGGDTLVIASGTCTVPNGLVAAALQVTGGALLVGTTGDVNAEVVVTGDLSVTDGQVVLGSDRSVKGRARLAVGGDLTLDAGADVRVFGGPLADAYTFATGSSFIEVGGVFTLESGSTLSLYSDKKTGGSVKITAADFTVAEGATVDAKEKGFMWLDAVTPPDSPGVGRTYELGASHGGIGRGNYTSAQAPEYDFKNAPVMPGSPNGVHNLELAYAKRGGGVIRVHAAKISVAGTLDADSAEMNGYGGASGGSIWLTAEKLDFAPTAVLTAKGCGSGWNGSATTGVYGSMGAGGRIAIEGGLTAAQIETLAETGEGFTRRVRNEAKFMELYSGVDVTDAVRGGWEYGKDGVYGASGSFVFLPVPQGLLLLVR